MDVGWCGNLIEPATDYTTCTWNRRTQPVVSQADVLILWWVKLTYSSSEGKLRRTPGSGGNWSHVKKGVNLRPSFQILWIDSKNDSTIINWMQREKMYGSNIYLTLFAMVKNERIAAFWSANSRYNWDHVTNAPMSRCQLDLFVSVVLITKESTRLKIPAYAQ